MVMINLLNRLLKLFAWRQKQVPLADRALAIIRDRFSPCSICGCNLEGHAFVKLASSLTDDSTQQNQELEHLISTRQWKLVSGYQDWRSDGCVWEYYLLRCPQKSQIALIRLLSTPEMWTDDQVGTGEALDQRDYETILSVVGERWVTL